MSIEIIVPEMGESIAEATVSTWLKQTGETVSEGEIVAELETDKVIVEVPAPETGILAQIEKQIGDTVQVGQVLAILNQGGLATPQSSSKEAQKTAAKEAPKTKSATSKKESPTDKAPTAITTSATVVQKMGPAARKMAAENHLNPAGITPTGPRGILTKDDLTRKLREDLVKNGTQADSVLPSGGVLEERVKMSTLRQRIAERLLEAQHQTAMLTTFNEVDLSQIIALRKRYQEVFEKKYKHRLGFMSFFTKACVQALIEFPNLNASIDNDEIIYKYYYDIGVAVSTDRGLVVPVVRNADRLSHIEIEQEITRLATAAKERKLTVQDLERGTFTITNGGVYGSMLSTPIINPPQAGILGMHNIIPRPVAIGGQVEIRPMMYLALSYDHRLVDGREAVQFLVKVRQYTEDPSRLLLEI